MCKIYFYELRRAVFSKFFIGLLAVCLFFSWQTLTSETIQGISNTAPFSSWSFGSYVAGLLPLLGTALLLLLHRLYSGKAREVQVLTRAAPIQTNKLLACQCAAVLTAWCLLALMMFLLGMVFLAVLFGGAVRPLSLLAPAVLVLVPSLVFITGIGLAAGKIHPSLFYILMALVLLSGILPLPDAAALFGKGYFNSYPLSAGTLDPVFTVTAPMLIGRAVYLAAGAFLLFIGLMPLKHKNKLIGGSNHV